ncbi:hypothetical protein ACIBL8_45955 [Streptomyces sp. NPDC050523]|uniref:hypothetical protein n=1 Tax=Streptomyces sp. NPDC050523 TaxID=3365622 RepID=UPI0037A029A3
MPTGSKGTPQGNVPKPDDVDRKDADAVSKGVLTVMWTLDTAIDSGMYDATVRAADAGWLTAEYASQVREHRPRSAPGAQWQEWAGHRVHTSVALERTEEAGRPADTGTEALRQWTVTVTPHGRDRWTGEPLTVVAYVRLTRAAADQAWRIADVTVQ